MRTAFLLACALPSCASLVQHLVPQLGGVVRHLPRLHGRRALVSVRASGEEGEIKVKASEMAKRALVDRLREAEASTQALIDDLDPLQAECAELERQREDHLRRQADLRAAKLACERALVTLPAELAQLRETTAALEASIGAMQGPSSTLESEHAALTAERDELIQRHDSLVAGVAQAESDVAAQRAANDELRERLASQEAVEAAARETLAAQIANESALLEREAATAALIAPLEADVSAAQKAVEAAEAVVATTGERQAALATELAQAEQRLAALKSEYEPVRTALNERRSRLASARAERDALLNERAAAQVCVKRARACCVEMVPVCLSAWRVFELLAHAFEARRARDWKVTGGGGQRAMCTSRHAHLAVLVRCACAAVRVRVRVRVRARVRVRVRVRVRACACVRTRAVVRSASSRRMQVWRRNSSPRWRSTHTLSLRCPSLSHPHPPFSSLLARPTLPSLPIPSLPSHPTHPFRSAHRPRSPAGVRLIVASSSSSECAREPCADLAGRSSCDVGEARREPHGAARRARCGGWLRARSDRAGACPRGGGGRG